MIDLSDRFQASTDITSAPFYRAGNKIITDPTNFVVRDSMDARIRKQIYDLRPEDLQQCPAWELALDEEGIAGQDEATVRPLSPDDPVDGCCFVLTEFVLADGTRMIGYVSAEVREEHRSIGVLMPVIVTENGQVDFWYGKAQMTNEQLEKNFSILGKQSSEVFPVRFTTLRAVTNGPISGIIEGFRGYEKSQAPKAAPAPVQWTWIN